MKRQACQLSLIIAVLAAAPAGAQIVKCVAPDGQVTLTDQPCSDGASTVPLEAQAVQAVQQPSARPQPALEHYPAPRTLPRQGAWSKPAPRRTPLARDVATLKAARVQLLLMDGNGRGQHPRLAGLN